MPTTKNFLKEAELYYTNLSAPSTTPIDEENRYFKLIKKIAVKEFSGEMIQFIVDARNKMGPGRLHDIYVAEDSKQQLNLPHKQNIAFKLLSKEFKAQNISAKQYFLFFIKGGTHAFPVKYFPKKVKKGVTEDQKISFDSVLKTVSRLLRTRSIPLALNAIEDEFNSVRNNSSPVTNTPYYKTLIKGDTMINFNKEMKAIKAEQKTVSNPKTYKTIKKLAEDLGTFSQINSADDVDDITAYLDKKSAAALAKYLKTCGCKTWKDTLKKVAENKKKHAKDKKKLENSINYLLVFSGVLELHKVLEAAGE